HARAGGAAGQAARPSCRRGGQADSGAGEARPCVISALTIKGEMSFMVFEGRFQAPTFIAFCERLIKQTRRKVFLTVDSHPVHRAAMTTQWLQENAARIERFFLPGYPPDLNPHELLNG